MPRYELALILKDLPRAALATALKRSCQHVWKEDGVVRKIENLGTKPLPYRMHVHGSKNVTGSYFVMNFDSSTNAKEEIEKRLRRDAEIVRPTIFSVVEDDERPCMRGLECQFGENVSLIGERLSWRTKALKKTNLYAGLKKNKKN
ncbi:28S ribosomal protein S6, mitochondrial-like [Mizuhopecten yessoensis]|uniref:Small ribosomal subunit protein bS6m n=1 Tax=Mizuhopecten yessoensis TaxID=6573 RepID=A0A210QEG6_MIZYE|nr:28S ribosomal protein S6, mitochondrial-like [Mizuhopecten yessoensis]OWF47123.1 28S ribosomal protein S6, mitochondrial [Mizuhopecten yessoensis]